MTLTLDINIDSISAQGVLDQFMAFAETVATAVNIEHARAERLEKLGITAGQYYREALENFGLTLGSLLPQ